MARQNVIIMGAAGRDFHNFNTYYRNNPNYNVVAFTATQIPDIHGRKYPAELAGELYPEGIPIFEERELPELIAKYDVDDCVLSYSDVPYEHAMNLSAIVNAAGANFVLLGPKRTMLKSEKPVIAVCATRTGTGKSQTSRRVAELLLAKGLKVVAVRHPMPYGDLAAQRVQRFAVIEDLAKHDCTIEEMEEYEPHIERGNVVYAGVDYEAILAEAVNDPDGCDVILWDGGNNDFPFYKPDLLITVADPHRAGHELSYYPGEVNLRMADVVIINKVDSAAPENIELVRSNTRMANPTAVIIDGASPIKVDNPEVIRGKRVLIVEDGPTLTHGDMSMGAGTLAAQKYGAAEIIDPRPYAVRSLAETYKLYPHLGAVLPAMGYGAKQIADLEATIAAIDCDAVIVGTPIDLARVVKIDKPNVRVRYDLQEIGSPNLAEVLEAFLKEHRLV
ncbi:MAG: GTPase [Firmicutes bacterium]|jgi:predicted GTPase|nr:cyclic 2,3-diphosphoglycerate synthase [Bacillota bacterium]NLO66268.1 GTPase [Bacillota bacterium]